MIIPHFRIVHHYQRDAFLCPCEAATTTITLSAGLFRHYDWLMICFAFGVATMSWYSSCKSQSLQSVMPVSIRNWFDSTLLLGVLLRANSGSCFASRHPLPFSGLLHATAPIGPQSSSSVFSCQEGVDLTISLCSIAK
jgi:hypothetical protein